MISVALGTSFNVLADSGGIWLYRDSDWPREMFFHGGELSIDHKLQQTSTADARRLWEMEQQTRALMPHALADRHRALGRNRQTRPTDGRPTGCKADAQVSTIEANANALCTQVQALRQLQDALEFRYQGKRLQLLAPLQDDTPRHDTEQA